MPTRQHKKTKIDIVEQRYMLEALKLARRGAKAQEVPIGAVLVRDGKIISRAHNLTRSRRDPTAHAEMVVLQHAAKKIRNERLTDTSLYVTLEPCAMCAGAVVQARLFKVVFAAKDPRAGACGSVFRVIPNRKLNHRPRVVGGLMADRSVTILKRFFRKRRK